MGKRKNKRQRGNVKPLTIAEALALSKKLAPKAAPAPFQYRWGTIQNNSKGKLRTRA